jgi:hypothetical protein
LLVDVLTVEGLKKLSIHRQVWRYQGDNINKTFRVQYDNTNESLWIFRNGEKFSTHACNSQFKI